MCHLVSHKECSEGAVAQVNNKLTHDQKEYLCRGVKNYIWLWSHRYSGAEDELFTYMGASVLSDTYVHLNS